MPILNRVHSHSVLNLYHPNNRTLETNFPLSYTYRAPNLKLPPVSLGWELEANRAPETWPAGVEQTSDGSVNEEGAEFILLPAITRSPRYVLSLLKDLVHTPSLNTDTSCGFHVHVGSPKLTLKRAREWAIATERLAKEIEGEAFDAVPEARQDNKYCRSIRLLESNTRFTSQKHSNDRRYAWLNTVEMFRPNGIRTIEIRLLGNTHRWKYLLAWTAFCLELCRRGFEMSVNPYEASNHVRYLKEILGSIKEDIKPKEKRNEPIPEWVYSLLKVNGITSTAFERPLASLVSSEFKIIGRDVTAYSDDQTELVNEEGVNAVIGDDYCECGCGEEGICDSQLHTEGRCTSQNCYNCHSEGICSRNSRFCDPCQRERHNQAEGCFRDQCYTCNQETSFISPLPRGVYPNNVVIADEIVMPRLFNITTSNPTNYCNPGCVTHHQMGSLCRVCNIPWLRHSGHLCESRDLGSFEVGR